MVLCNEQHLQRVTSDFLQRATSTTNNEQQWATSDFTTSKEQRVNFNSDEQQVKSYASSHIQVKTHPW